MSSPERIEDAALLTGRARFLDDLGEPPGCLHLAMLRSPHAHAVIEEVDVAAALALPGVEAVITGADLATLTTPLLVGVRLPMDCWPLAHERVRYVGEPVVVVAARSRYLAEDALDLVSVRYTPLPAAVTTRSAATDVVVLHERVGTNLVSDRQFRYGDPDTAFAEADHRVEVVVRYPRNAVTPIECYGVLASYDAFEDAYDVTATFQGPFSMHSVLSRALRVPGNRLRLRTPPCAGGSFGVKQGVFPYIVIAGVAARVTGHTVKWIEDRLEHLTGSVSATNRETTLTAAVTQNGRVTALKWDQLEDVGAYLRAPEPATLYRMHGNMTGAYDISHMAIHNRVVVSNKTPTGLVRGFGGPQVYFALERLMHQVATRLGLDPLGVIERNLIPAAKFPYRTASGALYDSGDYAEAVALARERGCYVQLLAKRDQARAAGKLYGIGHAAVVEPSVSNMGYVSTVLTPEERARSGPKNGAQATATVAVDPVGSVSVHVASVPQGQGHRTVLAHVVGEVLGLAPEAVQVNTDLDTGKDAWSIASGNYASRFAAAVAGTAKIAAEQMRERLRGIACTSLNVPPADIVFGDGKIYARSNPDNALPFARVAATSHWAPATVGQDHAQALRETAFWTPPELTAPAADDRVNSSLCHGFILDFCGVEVDPDSGRVRIDRYVSTHDCGRILHQGMVDGQIRGSYANAIGAAFYEEYAYSESGDFLAGTFADYLVPTATEVPPIEIHHMQSPSPFTPLGAKGVGEGNCMSTPVALANAVSDALGADVNTLPMTPSRVLSLIDEPEPGPGPKHETDSEPDLTRLPATAAATDHQLQGSGEITVSAEPAAVWNALLDPDVLRAAMPGCDAVTRIHETLFEARAELGAGPVKGRFDVKVTVSDLQEPTGLTLNGSGSGPLGTGAGTGWVKLTPYANGTRIHYRYAVGVGGKVAAVGARMLDGAARLVLGQFFNAFAKTFTDDEPPSWWSRWTRRRRDT